jgi:hypothetical protein
LLYPGLRKKKALQMFWDKTGRNMAPRKSVVDEVEKARAEGGGTAGEGTNGGEGGDGEESAGGQQLQQQQEQREEHEEQEQQEQQEQQEEQQEQQEPEDNWGFFDMEVDTFEGNHGADDDQQPHHPHHQPHPTSPEKELFLRARKKEKLR